MRTVLILCLQAGCVAAPHTPAEPPLPEAPTEVTPEVEADVEGEAPPTAPETEGCLYDEGLEPTAPPAPTGFCRAESLDEAGQVVELRTRRVEEADGVATVTTERFDGDGALVVRSIRRAAGDRLLYESKERIDLPPEATLPYTYGQAATWATTYTWDARGRLVTKAWDQAIDGVVDTEERWAYDDADVVREHTRLNRGGRSTTETFDAAGQPLLRIDARQNGTRWIYDDQGWLEREETLGGGEVNGFTEWEMAGRDRPLRATVVVRGEEVGGTTWRYAPDRRLASTDSWRLVSGHRRRTQVEFDAQGREVRYVEQTEDADCHHYERVTQYSVDVLAYRRTTCDGRLFERMDTEIDDEGRAARVERLFIGNPSWRVHEVERYAWDACGARTLSEHVRNGELSRRERLAWDERGRLLRRVLESRHREPQIVDYEWDAAGRVSAIGAQRWTYDAEGRVIRVTRDPEPLRFRGPPVVEIRYAYDCR